MRPTSLGKAKEKGQMKARGRERPSPLVLLLSDAFRNLLTHQLVQRERQR